jgi:superfamily II DNA or RNA helicase
MALSDHEFQVRYQKPEDDVAGFYNDCLSEAVSYDRLTGYFSRSVLIILWSAMIGFANRGGKIRLLCSPLTRQDGEIIKTAYHAKSNAALEEEISEEFKKLLQNPKLSDAASALAGLITEGILDIRFAHIKSEASASVLRMVHDKTGVFSDGEGNKLAFAGSMNETYLGLSADGNIESIDAFPNWLPDAERDRDRTIEISETFNKMWKGDLRGVEVTPFPDASRLLLEDHASTARPWKEIAKELKMIEETLKPPDSEKIESLLEEPLEINLRLHQRAALESWGNNNFRGVVAHATGAGKTITAIQAIRDHSATGGHTLVIVPGKELLKQWDTEINRFKANKQSIRLCGGGNTDWQLNLGAWLSAESPQVIIAISNTACDPAFVFRCKQAANNLLVVGDEVHGLGARNRSHIFEIDAEFRLGLSATPKRHNDPKGTKAIEDYFGPIIHEYSIFDAIKDGFLVDYRYFPSVVQLNNEEQEKWEDFSAKIGKLIARHGSLSAAMKDKRVQMLLIQRSRIAKKASEKIGKARMIASEQSASGQRWLVYCEDTTQLSQLREELISLDLPLPVYDFHSNMKGDREATLSTFEEDGGIIVSIRCLDEGVDIPDASHALILASSQNPRQFIQRRGRVLRLPKNKETKPYADIYDVLVVPQPPVDVATNALVLSEIGRSVEFCKYASNKECGLKLLEQLATIGINLADCQPYLGTEIENEEED